MRFSRRVAASSATPLAPLLDVVLLLLIFFVVTSSFATRTLDLELPSAEAAGDAPRNPLVVALDAEGAIEVDGRVVSVDELAERFAAAREAERPIELRADRSTAHEHVVAVLDRARIVGLGDLSIAVGSPRIDSRANEGASTNRRSAVGGRARTLSDGG